MPSLLKWPARCVQVNVFRNGDEKSQSLPIYFGSLIGVTDHGTRATATAIAARANGSQCLKPWFIPDLWKENSTPPNNKFNESIDIYTPPNPGPGTGYTTAHIGTELTPYPGNPNQAISPGDFFEIEEAQSYEEAIAGCHITKAIGDTITTLPGRRVGPTGQGLRYSTSEWTRDCEHRLLQPGRVLRASTPDRHV